MSKRVGEHVWIAGSNCGWVVTKVLDGGLEITAGEAELSIPTQEVRDEVIIAQRPALQQPHRFQCAALDPKEMAEILAKRDCLPDK